MAAGTLTFDLTWMDAHGIDDPAAAATWGGLKIAAVGGSGVPTVVTRLLDRHARTVREEVVGSTLPLAEWLALSWPHLFDARRLPPDADDEAEVYGWSRVHRWRYAGDGAALPDATIFREDRSRCRFEWRRDGVSAADAFSRAIFLESGCLRLATDEVRRVLSAFVGTVISRLMAVCPEDPRAADLRDAWRAATDKRDPRHADQVAAARIGLFWPDLDDAGRQRVRRLTGRADNPVVEALVDSWDSRRDDEYLRFADSTWGRLQGAQPLVPDWRELVTRLRAASARLPAGALPWEQGSEAAKLVRLELGWSDDRGPTRAELDRSQAAVQATVELPMVDSLVGWAPGRTPVRLVRPLRRPLQRRFAQARDLYALLLGGDPDRACVTVFSRRVAGANSVANSFAAELLAPTEELRRQFGPGCPVVDEQEVESLAQEMDAPYYCVVHQLANNRIARIGGVDPDFPPSSDGELSCGIDSLGDHDLRSRGRRVLLD
ncbi:MAG: hypothetical protein HY905_17815 [Deltaproteobacteria bacterium]|nr:hypothetical protein [Deltaproteobacteria bacterium]